MNNMISTRGIPSNKHHWVHFNISLLFSLEDAMYFQRIKIGFCGLSPLATWWIPQSTYSMLLSPGSHMETFFFFLVLSSTTCRILLLLYDSLTLGCITAFMVTTCQSYRYNFSFIAVWFLFTISGPTGFLTSSMQTVIAPNIILEVGKHSWKEAHTQWLKYCSGSSQTHEICHARWVPGPEEKRSSTIHHAPWWSGSGAGTCYLEWKPVVVLPPKLYSYFVHEEARFLTLCWTSYISEIVCYT